jgi:hypothetical protein
MTITMTIREIFGRSIWLQVCEMKGINRFAVVEGQANMDKEITFTESEAVELGLVPRQP